jgi:hypothetical protein
MLQSNWNATNTSYYLATNPFGFYNSTTLPAGTEALWNANYSTFLTHVTWANAINGTLATWAQVMNGTVSSGGSGVPVNTISAFNQANCPTGWVLADGTLGTPDLRGIFLRGSGTSGILNMSNGTAFIATYGTYQNDSFQGHQHSLPTTTSTGVTENNPGLYLGEMKYTNTVGSTSQYNTNAPLNPLTDNTNGIPRTGAETNPAYYATIYCVKTAEDTAVSNSIWGESGNNVILQNISKSLVINNTNFVVNTTLGNVGIGTTSPETTMEILSDTNQYGTLRIKGKTNVASQYGQLSLLDSTAIAAGVGGQILFGGKYTGTSYTEWGSIIGAKENATDGQYGGYMAFQTRPNGGVNTERMRILWNGNVGIGTTSPQKQLQIGDAGIAAPINNIIIKSMANTASAHTLVESMGAYSIVIAAADTQIYIYYTDSTGAARVATLAGTLIT